MFELILLLVLISFSFGAAFIMASRRKKDSTILNVDFSNNVEELAEKIGKIIAKEIVSELANLNIGSRSYSGKSLANEYNLSDIRMDESIVPIDLTVEAESSNLENMSKKEISKDKDLSKSKNKLAGLLKKKKGDK